MYDLWREPTLGYSAYVHPTSYRRRDKALAADPHVGSAAAADVGVELCSLEELVKRSDFVVFACLLNKETRHLLKSGSSRTDEADRLSHQCRARPDR